MPGGGDYDLLRRRGFQMSRPDDAVRILPVRAGTRTHPFRDPRASGGHPLISLSSSSSLLTLSSVDGCVSISPVRNLFLNFPNGLTIHRLADEASLKVLVWTEHPCSSFISALARHTTRQTTITENVDGTSKISVRTTKEVDASAICARCGGGGHLRAGGASLSCAPEAARAQILEAARQVYAESELAE